MADLRPGDLVDRISHRVRLGDDHIVRPPHARANRNCVARAPALRSASMQKRSRQARLFGAIFAGSSFITPFFLGTSAGAIASGRVPASGYGDPVGSWINPTSLVGGCLAVTTSVFLAGVFLTADADRARSQRLAERLRRWTLAVGVSAGIIVFAGLYPDPSRRADAQPRPASAPHCH